TGHTPFHAESIPRLLFEIVQSPPEPMGDVPPEVQQVVYRALAKDQAQRYQTAKEMLADLERLGAASEAVITRRLSTKAFAKIVEQASRSGFTPAAQPPRRRWILAAVGAAVLAGILFAIPGIRQRLTVRVFGPAEKHIAVLPFTAIGADA